MNKVDLSIVIPIYNEQESLLELYNQIQETLNNQFIYEIIFINDGSTDDSDTILRKMIKDNNLIRVIKFFNNKLTKWRYGKPPFKPISEMELPPDAK